MTSLRMEMEGFHAFAFCYFLFSTITICKAVDMIGSNESIRFDATLVSAKQKFELGFFSPDESKNWYIGIWYKNQPKKTVVWVANREKPLNDTNGVLQFTGDGLLTLLDIEKRIVWSTNSSRSTKTAVAKLLDTGNLVVKDGFGDDSPDNFLWQSFDYPCHTLLPDMKLGLNLVTGHEWSLSSWKTESDPAHGKYVHRIDPKGYPQNFVIQGSEKISRLGPWNGLGFSGYTIFNPNPMAILKFNVSKEEIFYRYDLKSEVLSMLVLSSKGIVDIHIFIDRTGEWQQIANSQTDLCDRYANCGAYGSCDIKSSPICKCLEGYTPKNQEEWSKGDFSTGCKRKTPLNCTEKQVFIRHQTVKLPDTSTSWYNKSMRLEECKTMCSKNCSCTAFANLDVRNGGTGCLLWFGDLVDIKESNTNPQDLYVRVDSSEAPRRNWLKVHIELGPAFVAVLVVLLVGLSVLVWRKKKNQPRRDRIADLKYYDYATIENATNNFSEENKLGEGGFGPVYKGVLEDGLEIAVKKLARKTEEGDNEFKNEVIYIAKLQHRNLVKLLGYSLQGSEKILVYEYLLHKSLDLFIFDPKLSKALDWSKRLKIIKKTARGLLYLHEDSRLNIIHRDLKASNILLDRDMNPKISDFGTARSFREEEFGGTTKRVVGTYGYMSPEYAMDGEFSAKSDVYSYGILVLEIVSGRKNRRLHQQAGQRLNLSGHAWNLFQDGRQMELIDASLPPPSDMTEMLRAIHVGLLCVQNFPEDRPKMATVVLMLEGDRILPLPKEPGFYGEKNMLEEFIGETSSVQNDECSVNMVSITHIEGR